MQKAFFILCIAVLAACAPADNGAAANDEWFTATVVTSSGSYPFTVEIADDEDEQRRGLMFRRSLAADAGMLFLYDEEQPLSYYMRNTYVSLDIIYINADGRIVSIARNTEPLSERSIPSGAPSIAVLEVVAGTSDRLGFAVGDEVRHPFFDGLER